MSKSIIKSTMLVTIFSFFIKFLGLIEQSVVANVCGVSNSTDAFFVSTGIIVNLCTVVFSSISVSFLSKYSETKINNGDEKANDLLNSVIKLFIPISGLLSLCFFILAPLWAKVFAPTYEGAQLATLSRYIQISSFSFVLWCYFLVINVVLEANKIFLPGRAFGFFQNVFLIIAAICLYPHFGIITLVYAFLFAGLAQCILVTFCARKYIKIFMKDLTQCTLAKQIFFTSVPLILGNAIYEINDIVDKQISTSLGEGVASVLNYGSTINGIVTGVIVSSVTVVIFSHFTTWVAQGKIQEINDNLILTINTLSVLIVPVMVMCIVAGDHIVKILYGRGEFSDSDVIKTYGVVIGYAIGFVFQAARANIVRVYYAFNDTKRPLINGSISVVINILLSIILSRYIGVKGIALSTSVSMLIVTILLLTGIKRYLPMFTFESIISEIYKAVIAGFICSVPVFLIKKMLSINIYGKFIIEGFICVLFYSVIMLLLKSNTINFLIDKMKKR